MHFKNSHKQCFCPPYQLQSSDTVQICLQFLLLNASKKHFSLKITPRRHIKFSSVIPAHPTHEMRCKVVSCY